MVRDYSDGVTNKRVPTSDMDRYRVKTKTRQLLLRAKERHEQQRYASWAGLCLYVVLDCLLHLLLQECVVWLRNERKLTLWWWGTAPEMTPTTEKRILHVLTVVSKTLLVSLAFEVLQRHWMVFEKPPISFTILFFLRALLMRLDLEL